MKLQSVNNIVFQRRLKESEKAEYEDVLKQAKQKIGNRGNSMLIVPSSSLPHGLNNNMGCGNLLNKESREFFDFAKTYWGINYVQLLPEGVYRLRSNGDYRPYSGSSLDLGNQIINLNLLTTKEYGKLLTEEDVTKVIESNKLPNKDNLINLENTMGEYSPVENALRKAFDRLAEIDPSQAEKLDEEFEIYYKNNSEWLEGKAIFRVLSKKNGTSDFTKWSEIERNLFDTSKISPAERERIIAEITYPAELGKERTYYMFKQFIADKHLAEAKKELNEKGIKLSGDMLVGCSKDEVWMNPRAFYHDRKLPWGLNAINFDTPEGKDFFRLKVRNFAKRYDGIRVDASWLYVTQLLSCGNFEYKKQYGSEILDIIDEEFRKIKGKDYNLQNISHEFEVDSSVYSFYDKRNVLKDELRERLKIFKTDYMNDSWETVDAFKGAGWKDGTYMLGATNHDTESLKELYENAEIRNKQVDILSKILKIPKEKLNTLQGFIQAKFAEPMRCFHNMFFFSDALNLDGSYNRNDSSAYKLKIPSNYQDKYFKSLEKGEGFNIMDAMEKAFVSEGLDKTEPELYEKIIKFRDILQGGENYEPPVKTKKTGKIALIAAGIAILTTAVIAMVKNNRTKTEAAKN